MIILVSYCMELEWQMFSSEQYKHTSLMVHLWGTGWDTGHSQWYWIACIPASELHIWWEPPSCKFANATTNTCLGEDVFRTNFDSVMLLFEELCNVPALCVCQIGTFAANMSSLCLTFLPHLLSFFLRLAWSVWQGFKHAYSFIQISPFS